MDMATVLDTILATGAVGGPSPSSDSEDHASSSAAPQAHLAISPQTAETIVLALVGFVILVYLLHVAERALRQR